MPLLSRTTRRKLRRFIGWERGKEAGVYVLDFLLKRFDVMPDRFYLGIIELFSAVLSAFYYFPWNPWRSACRDMAILRGRGRGRDIYVGLVENLAAVGRIYVTLLRHGCERAVEQMGFEDGSLEIARRVSQEYGGGFLLVPHCVGGILSAACFARAVPTVIISKGPPSAKRAEMQRAFIEMLGVELLVIDSMVKSTVARSIFRTVKGGKIIVATTDLMKKTDESLPATFFSQAIHLPSWPARFSKKMKRPIVPCYIFVRDGRLVMRLNEPFVAKSIEEGTERWSRAFQKDILESPADWAFLFDLRWGKLLAASVAGGS
jgi:lauroyl/myristoyl acyltransferase